MKITTTLLLAGAAAIAVGGAALAASSSPPVHEIAIALPGGAVEHIRYTGNVAPKVIVDENPFSIAWAPDPAFAMLRNMSANVERVRAQIDRQMAAANQAAFAAMNNPDAPMTISTGNLPPGVHGYTYISTFSSNGACTHVTRFTSDGGNAKPQVISQVSGNCGGKSAGAQTPNVSMPSGDNPELLHAHAVMHLAPAPQQTL